MTEKLLPFTQEVISYILLARFVIVRLCRGVQSLSHLRFCCFVTRGACCYVHGQRVVNDSSAEKFSTFYGTQKFKIK